jgi:NADPH:quinone reductase-like Zn-dependent oxidoreductase
MRAIRYRSFGPPDVLEVVDVDPPEPAAGEVRVRVVAASLNPLDWKIRDGHLKLVPVLKRPPRGTGTDFAGEVVALGGGTGPRHVGERVFGSLSPFARQGSCAQFVTAPAHHVCAIPASLSFEEAATLPVAGGTAVQALADDAPVVAGQRVLVTGGAGGVGHFAVRYAKHLGAHVTATCGPANVDFVKSQGADRVIDYTRTDVATCGETFDVVFDAVNALDWRRARHLLVRGGTYLGTAGSASAAIVTAVGSLVAPLAGGIRVRNLALRANQASLERLARLAALGVLQPHVERRIGLDEVAQAQREMQRGHGRGKIVVLPDRATSSSRLAPG